MYLSLSQPITAREYAFLVTAVLPLLLAAIICSRLLVKQRYARILVQRNEVIARQNRQIEEMNQQLKMKILQTRLNPHFLFNSLNSIQYFVNLNEKKVAQEYIGHFSTFIRQVLLYGDELLIGAEQEALLVEQYLWLEQRRFPDRFVYKVTIDPEVQLFDLPPLLVHGLLEKILYNHILNNTDHRLPVQVYVRFKARDHRLLISVEDNGRPAATRHWKSPGSKDGEHILEKRLHLINLSAAIPIQVRYQWNEGTNTAELVIPQPLFNRPYKT